jgi:hypothetical protein
MYTFKLCYGRQGTAYVVETTCGHCKKTVPCLTVDGSEEEYGEIDICMPCIQNLFKQHEDESDPNKCQYTQTSDSGAIWFKTSCGNSDAWPKCLPEGVKPPTQCKFCDKPIVHIQPEIDHD